MNLHIVIARYNESLDWLDTCLTPLQRRSVWIYNKGLDPISVDGVPDSQIKTLPNIGREAHTYLMHIIEQWDNLPERVYFIQADPFPHLEFNPTFELVQKWFGAWDVQILRDGFSKNIKVSPVSRDSRQPFTDSSDLGFGDWMEKWVCPFQSPISWYMGAIFGVLGSNIKKRPKEYFLNLVSEFKTLNPETAYYIERCWYYIFTYKESPQI